MDRAQPERSVTLLDRALASYRLEAHEKPPHLAQLQARIAAAKGDEAKALTAEIARATQEWEQAQGELRAANRRQREGEEELAKIEWEITDLGKREVDQRTAVPERSFNLMANKGGFKSAEIQQLETKRDAVAKIVEEAKAAFASNAKAINDRLLLTRDLVLVEFSRITGIPASKLNEDERVKLLRLEQELNEAIFDQTTAIAKISNGVKVAKRGRRNRNAPVAFMCLGPSGVGKTETWKQVARLLGLDLLRFDMSEYMEKHAVAKLIGAPPGYEGFDAGGILTNSMRKNPRRVCLFDEIEKGHPSVFDVFMQVLSDGRLTDSLGRTVDFSNAYIGFTTNIGQSHFLDASLVRRAGRGTGHRGAEKDLSFGVPQSLRRPAEHPVLQTARRRRHREDRRPRDQVDQRELRRAGNHRRCHAAGRQGVLPGQVRPDERRARPAGLPAGQPRADHRQQPDRTPRATRRRQLPL